MTSTISRLFRLTAAIALLSGCLYPARSGGSGFTVSRIPEELEFAPGLLKFLEAAAIQPGRSGVVTASSPDGTVTVEIEGHHVGVGEFASSRILVTA